MFRQTHIRLTLLNSFVFIILLSILGSIIYFYSENKLYHDVNESLWASANHFQNPRPLHNRGELPNPGFINRDPRNLILFWDENNQLLTQQNREYEFFGDNISMIQPKQINTFEDVEIDGFTYRYIATRVETKFGEFTIQIIRNIDSEKGFLDKLLLIIVVGCGVGILCAIGFGYFLAGRALIPIKNAWKKQQQFVSDASHELRTPLAVIQAKTDLLFRAPSATIQEKIVDVSTISTESRRLSKLVSNLLTLARSDTDQIEMNKKAFQLDELLKQIVLQFEDIVVYQGKSIHLEADEGITFIADKERIHQLFVILLDNAMKFTNEGDEIRVSCNQSHTSISIRVEDTGIGIPEEDTSKIFDRFFQSDKARTGEKSGTGLGLSIAKWIIDKHAGKVKVKSSLGVGTTIEIQFSRMQK